MSVVKIKMIKSIEHFSEIEKLYGEIWGSFNKVPLHNLITVARNGGIVLGAFNNKEKMVGFSYGFPGVSDLNSGNPRIYLCSHILGILKDYRNLGIGEELKWEQYDQARKIGFSNIQWTFDPLEAINANLNFHKLGAIGFKYSENCYGFINDNLNKGIPTDRLVVDWDVNHTLAQKKSLISSRRGVKEYYEVGKVIGTEDNLYWEVGNIEETSGDIALKLPIPKNIQKIKYSNPDLAKKWRNQFREVIQRLFAKGFQINDFKQSKKDVNHFYILTKNKDPKVPVE
ncbi:hypothetical protein [Alkalihalobacterium alkalinitrilicum]|uniref:hypothetical protein n=1 Tax=Alkalihalobacterium alkalinitrilicum TaxID=427920 RepID=UPI000995273E|nr:hypothetical protein [Alkalihalobacterium alkalinitrilicum]